MAKVLGPLAILVLLVVGGLWLASGARDDMRGLDASVLGAQGLATALQGQGMAAQMARPGTAVKIGDLGLRVQVLYDMDLDDARPETLGDISQRTINRWTLHDKLFDLPTLVVLPKWRWVVAEKGVAAPETAIPLADYAKLFEQLGLKGLRLVRGGPEFVRHGEATLFLPQLFDMSSLPATCNDRVPGLVIACDDEEAGEVFYLSDPDLLNTHGVTLGQNARAAAGLLRLLSNAPKKPVYIDPYAEDYLVSDQGAGQDYERGADDLLRFFKPPLGAIWAMLSILLALLLWRGGRRFGPVVRAEEAGRERSVAEIVAARARLIRLTGQDGAMVADYVQGDLSRMAEAAFGRGRGEVARLWPLLSRRNPDVAEAFRGLAQELLRGAPQPAAQLRRQLDTYHQLQRTLTHDA